MNLLARLPQPAMASGSPLGGIRSLTSWRAFAFFALVLLIGNASHADVCNYDGGWSLRFPQKSTCPGFAPNPCNLTLDSSQSRCCPADYECRGEGDFLGQYCCKDEEDCTKEATENAKCPIADWSLWGTNTTNPDGNNIDTGVWCCDSNSKGVYKDSGEVGGLVFLCTGTAETALPTTLYSASPISQCSATGTSATGTSTTSTSATSTSTTSTPTSTPASTNDPGDANSSAAGPPVGAIAGGVVGGVAGIALVVAGIYFFLKRKKRRRSAESTPAAIVHEGVRPSRADDPRWRRPSELETVEPRLEMDGAKPTYELDAAKDQERERDVSPTSLPPG